MPSSTPLLASKKKKAKLSASSSSSGTATLSPAASQLASLQSTLASSTDLNPLTDLLALIRTLAFPTSTTPAHQPSEKVLPRATAVLVHSLQSLLASHSVPLDAATDEEGKLLVSAQTGKVTGAEAARKQVRRWIAERWNEAVVLLNVLLGHDEGGVRLLALKHLLNLQRDASSSLSTLPSTSSASSSTEAATQPGKWSASPFRSLVLSLLAGAPQPSSFASPIQRQGTIQEDVRGAFVDEYLECYDDVRFCTCREIRSILSAPPASASAAPLRTNGTQLLLLLTAIPTQKSDLNAFLVPQLSTPPRDAKLAKSNKGSLKKVPKVVDGGGSEEEDEEEEEDMEDWFSDSDDEQGKPKQPKSASSSSAPTKLGAAAARRRTRQAPAVAVAVHVLSAQKAAFSAAWLAVLLPVRTTEGGVKGGEVPLALSHEVLVRMHAQILPHLVKPRLLVDWLVDCLEAGGATSLLALNGLYTLMISHNLQYPSFYTSLYALLLSPTAPFLHVRYRARFLRLLDTFLSSSHLPAALIASFAKRLSRAALRAPPAAAVSIVPFVWNLCKRHKGCMEMLHRVYNEDRLSDGPAGVVDPYDPLLADPLKTRALSSSLWELSSLGASLHALQNQGFEHAPHAGEAHYLHGVSTLAHILAEPFTKEKWDLEDFLDVTYATLFEGETGRTLRPKALKVKEGQTLKTPVAPALAYKAQEGADVFPTQAAKAAKEAKVGEKRSRQEMEENLDDEDEEEREAREAMREVEERQKQDTLDVCAQLWTF